MLPKFEYGQLYKFAVSLGLLLLGLSIAVPWLVLRDSGPLTISEDDLAGLTPRAQRVIRDKQQDFEWIVNNYRYGSGALAGLGFGIGAYGFLKWKKRQDVADDVENVQRDTARAQLRVLTPAEVEEKLERETSAVLTGAAISIDQADSTVQQSDSQEIHRYVMGTIVRSEQLVFAKLGVAFGESHQVISNVEVKLASGRALEIDAVVRANDAKDVSYALELKVARGALLAMTYAVNGIVRATAAARAYAPLAEGAVSGLLLVIIDETPGWMDHRWFVPGRPKEAAADMKPDSVADIKAETSAWLKSVPGVIGLVFTQEEVSGMDPRDLRHAIESSGKEAQG